MLWRNGCNWYPCSFQRVKVIVVFAALLAKYLFRLFLLKKRWTNTTKRVVGQRYTVHGDSEGGIQTKFFLNKKKIRLDRKSSKKINKRIHWNRRSGATENVAIIYQTNNKFLKFSTISWNFVNRSVCCRTENLFIFGII